MSLPRHPTDHFTNLLVRAGFRGPWAEEGYDDTAWQAVSSLYTRLQLLVRLSHLEVDDDWGAVVGDYIYHAPDMATVRTSRMGRLALSFWVHLAELLHEADAAAAASESFAFPRLYLARSHATTGYLAEPLEITTADALRPIVKAHREQDLRHHSGHAKIQGMAVQAANRALEIYVMPTSTEAERTARTAAITALETQVAALEVEWFEASIIHDPNLMVNVIPSSDEAITLTSEFTKTSAKREHRYSGTFNIVNPVSVTLRNVVSEPRKIPVAGARMRPELIRTTDVGDNAKTIGIALPMDTPAGTYTGTIEAHIANVANPVAEIALTMTITKVTANAGADVSVESGGTVQIGGEDIVEGALGATTIAWDRLSGSGGSLDSTSAVMPTFTAPTVTVETTITMRKIVTNNGVSNTDDVVITVTAPAGE